MSSAGPSPPPAAGGSTRAGRGARAQTTLDYAVGAGVFLVAAAFVLAFVPGMLAPFGGADRTQVVDRAATALAGDALGDPSSPSVLDETCAAAFFERRQGDRSPDDVPDSCRFDADPDTVAGALGVGAPAMNVTVERADGRAYELATDGGTVALRAGPPAPDDRSVAAARRTVFLDGRSLRLVVRAW